MIRSEAWRNGEQGRWNLTLTGDANALRVSIELEGWTQPPQAQVRVFVPMDEARKVECVNGTLAADQCADRWRCLTIALAH